MNGPVDDAADSRFRNRRESLETFRQRIGNVIQPYLQKIGFAKVPGRSLHGPGRRVLFVHAKQHAVVLLAQVHFPIEVENQRQLAVPFDQFVDFPGQQIVMFHRHDGNVHAGHGPHFPGPEPGRVDDVLTLDVSLVGNDGPGAVRLVHQVLDHRVHVDLGAALARSPGQRLGRAVGIDVAFVAVEQPTDDVGGVHDRAELDDLVRCQQMAVDTEHLVFCVFVSNVLPALLGCRHLDAAGEVHADVLPADLLHLPVHRYAIGLQPRYIGIAVHGVKAAGGMPGGTGGQLLALDKYHIRPTQLGQVIEHGGPDDTAADDDDAGVGFHYV